jgi:2-polyprenyl-6-methoxyphenol hydroxylase-like FAD-dependent oxidoreductase
MRVLIIGGGICGLGAALLLARDGHDVTVLERDAGTVPDSAQATWDGWDRKGVAQFRQPHNLMPGLRLLLEQELPDVQEALAHAGAGRYDLLHPLPPSLADQSSRAIDDQLWTLTARRPVLEWVFATRALAEPRVTVRRGLRVEGLLNGAAAVAGVPHVVGVGTSSGERIAADLVVDASGRQSRAREWLRTIGARAPYEEQADCGFFYYTRYFRGRQPVRRAPTLTHLGTITLLTLPGDNETWSVTIFTASNDQAMKQLRHEQPWTNVVRAHPLHAHWLDGEPLTGVLPMSGIVDRYRQFLVDALPVATGFAAVADAWACTNPSAGRGLTVGFKHALCLRDILRDAADDPRRLAEEFHARTEAEIAPWYHAQIAVDRARFADMEALRNGEQPPPANDLAARIRMLLGAMGTDPDLFRAALEYIGTITPIQDILQRSDVQDRLAVAVRRLREAPPPPIPCPTRTRLLELVQ